MQNLEQIPVTQLKGVGASISNKLAKLSINSIQDILFHLPQRYEDRTQISPIGALSSHEIAVIEGEVRVCNIAYGRRRSLVCRVQDHTGILSLRFFHFSAAQKNNLVAGTRIRCYGEVRHGRSGMEMYHPEYIIISDNKEFPLEDTLTPVYPLTEGMSQNRLRTFSLQALKYLDQQHSLAELIPPAMAKKLKFTELGNALRYLHHPPTNASLEQLQQGQHPAQKRLAFEELLAHHLSLQKLRHQHQIQQAPAFTIDEILINNFLNNLPFSLTKAQARAFDQICQDLTTNRPMLRLVQGDVGSGKTIVAALSALLAVTCDYQVAIMAPTEILAEQHYQSFKEWMLPLNIPVAWLSGKLKTSERKTQLESITSGTAKIAIGTHALFQEQVEFANLGLCIIDEQHRFGVHQRLALREKGDKNNQRAHQLIMTATPIPRTLTMSAYADLDCSIIDELPPGRTPVNTIVVSDDRRTQIIDRIRSNCEEGKQVYWVCTLIEESETLQCQAAEEAYALLQTQLPHLNIGLVHGRLKPREKSNIMDAFKSGQLQLLVATTVIEVGVNVPNASLMVIENPERLGLAQLHQLRGRVGRGDIASHCVLLYQAPLSLQGKERLQIMRETNDGFQIAEKDLELRGPGEILGTRQTGMMNFKIADLCRDAALLPQVKACAEQLAKDHVSHIDPIITRWLGQKTIYGQV